MTAMEDRRALRRQVTTATVLVALFLAAALPLILTDHERGRAADDQNMWHLPAIRQFARQLPHPDLHDYLSATTPLYHLLIAAADRWISPDLRVLRLFGALFTAGLLAPLWVAAWMGSDTGKPPARPAAPAARLAWIVMATVPAAAVVLYFFHLWHGPVPPSIQFFHDPTRAVGKSWNPAVPATVLGVFG